MKSNLGLPEGSPADVGLSSARLQHIGKFMQRYVDENKLRGLLTVVCRKGKVAYSECCGSMDEHNDIQPDTLFRIYSMTKPITTVAAMMLHEEGHFLIDDPISKFVPAFANVKVFEMPQERLVDPHREITFQDLMRHTSGLTYGVFDDTPVDQLYRERNLLRADHSLEDMIQDLVTLPLMYQPGKDWRYSVSTDVLGYLVEVISGVPFGTFLQNRIFEPLGMVDTGFYVPESELGRFAANYAAEEGGGITVIDERETSKFSVPQKFQSGGGGLVSTASDYIRFAQMLLNGGQLNGTRLLGRKTVELMTINHVHPSCMPLTMRGSPLRGYGFGLGFAVLMDVAQTACSGSVGEYRWGGAASTAFWIDPKEELIGLLLTQFMPSDYYPIRWEFKSLMYQALVD